MAKKMSIAMVSLWVFLFCGLGLSYARTVTLVLTDQYGNEITGSEFYISSVGFIATGESIEIGDGNYTVEIIPAIDGTNSYTLLHRVDEVEINDNFTGQFEWITTTKNISVNDQTGTPIPGSAVYVPTSGGYLLNNGQDGTFPITDNSQYPTMGGIWAEGMVFQVRPATGGTNQYGLLHRLDTVEIDSSFTGQFEWITTTKNISVNDQTGTPIPGSAVYVPTSGGYLLNNGQDGTFPITDNSQYPTMGGIWAEGIVFVVRPAIGGENYNTLLHRLDTVEIDSTFTGQFEWITTTKNISVNDQTGTPIPGSAVYVPAGGGYLLNNGQDGTFPITDNSQYPTMGGIWAEGIVFQVRPAIGGTNQYGLLHRLDTVEIDSTFIGQFEWITTTKNISVNDQTFTPIPDSVVYPVGTSYFLSNGQAGTFPITDNSQYPTIGGIWADGMQFVVRPGIGGTNSYSLLHRLDTVEIDSNFSGQFEWTVVEGPLYVVDETGIQQVEGSSYTIYLLGTYQSGDVVTLLTTDNNLYPTIGGGLSDGYEIDIYPGDQSGANEQYSFEFYGDYSVLPQFVNISDYLYGLRFQINNAPFVDAGPAVNIPSEDQSSTIIVGSASDQDGDPLLYKWREGAVVLLDFTAVLADGTAPLDLSTLPPLSIGEHTYTLEVTDGTATILANTVVTVNNSAPTVVALGGGVYEVGTDITLSAELADYDGDVLIYEWREGDIMLMAGSIETAIGGYPVTLPDYVVSGLEIGIHQLTLEVEDGATTPILASATVEVTDTTVPVLAPSATPTILWPPNHKFRDLTIQANASDNSGGTITLEAYVSSSEEPDTDGDGNTIPDYTDPQIDQNTGEITLQLRSERSGKGDGRIYTVVITATDESGNSSTASVNIVAPHNKSK